MITDWVNSAFGFLSRHIGSKLVPNKDVVADLAAYVKKDLSNIVFKPELV